MDIRFVTAGSGDVVAVMASEGGELLGAGKALDTAAGGRIAKAIKAANFKGGAGQVTDILAPDGLDFGRVLVIGFAAGRIPSATVNHVLLKQYSVVGVRAGEYGRVYPEGGRRVNRALETWSASGKLTPHVHARLRFDQLIEALDMIAARQVLGRVVCEIDA